MTDPSKNKCCEKCKNIGGHIRKSEIPCLDSNCPCHQPQKEEKCEKCEKCGAKIEDSQLDSSWLCLSCDDKAAHKDEKCVHGGTPTCLQCAASTPHEKWEGEFDEMFPPTQKEATHYLDSPKGPDCKCISCNATAYHPKIKSFIRDLLQRGREAGRMEGKVKEFHHAFPEGVREGADQERQRILEILEGMKREEDWRDIPDVEAGAAIGIADHNLHYNSALSDLCAKLEDKSSEQV